MAVVRDSAAVGTVDRLTGARRGHHNEEQVLGFFRSLISAVLPVDIGVADKAADLRSRFKSLRMPDALILATADVDRDTDLIVTSDRQMAKISGLSCKVRLVG